MSILSICISACMTRLVFFAIGVAHSLGQRGRNDLPRDAKLVLQPAALLFHSALGSFSHNSSTSSCVSQFTTNEMAGENLNCGPPFNAMKSCPSI